MFRILLRDSLIQWHDCFTRVASCCAQQRMSRPRWLGTQPCQAQARLRDRCFFSLFVPAFVPARACRAIAASFFEQQVLFAASLQQDFPNLRHEDFRHEDIRHEDITVQALTHGDSDRYALVFDNFGVVYTLRSERFACLPTCHGDPAIVA